MLADRDDGTCDLVINAVAKRLLRDDAGRGYGAGGAVPGSVLHQIRPDLVHLPTTNGDHSQGDGIQLAMDIGAKTIGLKHVQVHPTGLVNPDDPDNKTKFLAAEALRGEGGILLDREGNRFANDIGKRDYVTGRMWKHDKAPYRLILNSKAASNLDWHCKHYCSRRVMKHFKSGEALAKEMGIPTEQLKKSFDQYNEYAKAGTDPHGKIFFTNAPYNIDDSFYVAQVTPIVHYTMGGLAISPKAECVYDKTSRAIPGLYAAGELAGGVHGLNRLGGSALLECVVFGRVAGKNALEYIKTPKAVAGAGETTTITIPLGNGSQITVTHTTGAGTAVTAEGEKVDIIEWDEAS